MKSASSLLTNVFPVRSFLRNKNVRRGKINRRLINPNVSGKSNGCDFNELNIALTWPIADILARVTAINESCRFASIFPECMCQPPEITDCSLIIKTDPISVVIGAGIQNKEFHVFCQGGSHVRRLMRSEYVVQLIICQENKHEHSSPYTTTDKFNYYRRSLI